MNFGESLTLAEAGRLLGWSRPTVEDRITGGVLKAVEGASPVRVTTVSVATELGRLIRVERDKVARLSAAGAEVGLTLSPDEPSVSNVDEGVVAQLITLATELQQERVGRAAAETRIDQLKADLRRVNLAVQALLPAPDAGVDAPPLRGM